MTDRLNGAERIECRLVIIDSDSMRVLTTAAGAGSSLPRESVPAYTRVAGAFNEAIEQRYGLRTIQLAVLPGTTELISCAVHEIMGLQEQQLRSLSFAALDEVGSNDLTETERSLILKIMMGEANPLGRFARIGWIYELVAKAGGNRDRKSMPVTRQLNQGIDFCLLSLTDASGRKVWFKAVGEPNIHEYALTGELTRRFPSYLPKTVTTTPEWNGWVMEDANGLPLNESGAIYQCEEAFTALAIMQKEMATDIASLSAIGAKSWTWSRIAPLLDPFFTEAWRAMRAQTSDKSKPLSGGELNQLQRDIKSALDEFMNAGIPETLLHGDIGHGNVIATCEGTIFLDWAEAYIGHPFLTAEYLLADLARSNPMFAEKQAALRSHYASHWKGYVQPSELERIIGLAPAIAAFVYGVITWDANFYRSEPTQAWPLMRSMLRRTKRELERAAEFIA
jgi:hypothetical protein